MNKWIRTKERLPVERRYYLVCVECPDSIDGLDDFQYIDVACFDPERRFWKTMDHDFWSIDVTESKKVSFVSHWMELPELPKVE